MIFSSVTGKFTTCWENLLESYSMRRKSTIYFIQIPFPNRLRESPWKPNWKAWKLSKLPKRPLKLHLHDAR